MYVFVYVILWLLVYVFDYVVVNVFVCVCVCWVCFLSVFWCRFLGRRISLRMCFCAVCVFVSACL